MPTSQKKSKQKHQDELELLAKSEPKFEIFVENDFQNGSEEKYKGKKRTLKQEPKEPKKSKKYPKIDLEFKDSPDDQVESASKEDLIMKEIKELEAQNKEIIQSLAKSQQQQQQQSASQSKGQIKLQIKVNDCAFDVLHKAHQAVNAMNVVPDGVKMPGSLISKANLTLNYLFFLNAQFVQEEPKKQVLPADLDNLWSQIHTVNEVIFDSSLKTADRAFKRSNTEQKLKSKQLKAINQNISTQIDNFMRNPSKLIQRTQLNRKKVPLIGTQAIIVEDANFFDDSDWISTLLAERSKAKIDNHPASIASRVEALKRSKVKKVIDTKATKGRKIKYAVFDKLTNFMAPSDAHAKRWNDEKSDEFYSSLLGAIPKTLDE